MRKYIICIVSFIGAALLQTGCYDDKGDYDYHDVNTMDIVIPETKVRMPKEEAVEVSIIPEISQTLEQNEKKPCISMEENNRRKESGVGQT